MSKLPEAGTGVLGMSTGTFTGRVASGAATSSPETALPSMVLAPTRDRPWVAVSGTVDTALMLNAPVDWPTGMLVGRSVVITTLIGWSPINGNGHV